jgi:hypothetical protein
LHLCCGARGSELAVDRDVRRHPSGPCSARRRGRRPPTMPP